MTTVLEPPAAAPAADNALRVTRVAFDLTRRCQANCTHCYNQSSPQGGDGEMTRQDWFGVLDQAAELGVTFVQFIGGEPTLHPDLADLIDHALQHRMEVEVFSNLIMVKSALWRTFRQRGVSLATSYYSDDPAEHEAIVKHRNAHRKTKSTIAFAIEQRIPLRAEIVHVRPGQRVEGAIKELLALGVQTIHTHPLQEIGRGAGDPHATPQLTELCGQCGNQRCAIMPNGTVAACVMSSPITTVGSVRQQRLADILTSPEWSDLVASIPPPRSATSHNHAVGPDQAAATVVRGTPVCSPDTGPCGAVHDVPSPRPTDHTVGPICPPEDQAAATVVRGTPVCSPDTGPCGAVHHVPAS